VGQLVELPGGQRQVSDLIDTTEMYLRTIFELEEEGLVPMRARIAERIGHSGPTVSQTVARMERDGLVHLSDDRHLELTDAGRLKATRVMRKHRLAERLLLDVVGLEWEYVHEEACRWEHVMSDRVERKLLALLTDAEESPYGNPIPGLDELGGTVGGSGSGSGGGAGNRAFLQGVQSLPQALAAAAADGGQGGADLALMVRRIGEPVQSEAALLEGLARVALRPGRRVVAARAGNAIRVRTDQGELTLSVSDAQHVFVDVIVP
jgi:DtxR family Mn-dependent transcriptional regulator